MELTSAVARLVQIAMPRIAMKNAKPDRRGVRAEAQGDRGHGDDDDLRQEGANEHPHPAKAYVRMRL